MILSVALVHLWSNTLRNISAFTQMSIGNIIIKNYFLYAKSGIKNVGKWSNNYKQLKVHKLQGPLAGRHSFSVNYKTRIIFCYISKKEVVLLAIGDHSIYDK